MERNEMSTGSADTFTTSRLNNVFVAYSLYLLLCQCIGYANPRYNLVLLSEDNKCYS